MFKKGIYRHYKGNLYELVDIAIHSEDLSEMVVYRAFYGDRDLWVRPANMWNEEVEVDGRTMKRFEFVEEKMKKALVVVDYQNDFVDGALGFEGADRFETIICQKIEQYREDGGDVIFTFDTHRENYMNTEEGKYLPVPHCMEDSEGFMLYGKVAEYLEEGDAVFRKPTFGSLELGKYLENKEYGHIELCGLVSNICVLSNAVIAKAALPNAHIVVDKMATGSMSEEMDEKTFDVLEGIQVEVLNR